MLYQADTFFPLLVVDSKPWILPLPVFTTRSSLIPGEIVQNEKKVKRCFVQSFALVQEVKSGDLQIQF